MSIIQLSFCLGSISNQFGTAEFKEVSLKKISVNFFFDYNAIDKSCRA